MALEYVDRKKVEATFYRSCFRGTVYFTGALIVINLALSLFAAHRVLNPKPTQWIVTTVDGRLIQI